ncbi:MAG: hypothetical protein R3A80_13685 [Bdellovibrionota bacterium]
MVKKRINKSLKIIPQSGLIALFTLSSCGTFKVRNKDNAQVSSIKTVALVGMDVVEPVPKELGLNLGSGKVEADSAGGIGKFQQKSSHVEAMYQELHRALGLRLKWKVLPKQSMINNAGYKAAYTKTMKGWQNKMPPGQNQAQYVVEDVLDYDALRIMGQDGRDKLISDLGVNAIMVAKVYITLGGTSIMGFGPRHPKSTLTFQVYKKGIEAPVWFDGNVEGKEGDSVGATGLWSVEKLHKEGLDSAIDAFSKIAQERK